jgi:hypothetical protein
MQVLMNVVKGPRAPAADTVVEFSRLPVLGEYVRHGEDWYQIKRVLHVPDGEGPAGEVFVIPVVDPTRTPLELYEWLEPAP